MKLTIQQGLGLAAGLVATALAFITGFDQATDSFEVPTLVYLGLGLANALLGFTVAFLSTPMMMARQLIGGHRDAVAAASRGE